jgi:transcriptional regulator with XRE-family HTH domain
MQIKVIILDFNLALNNEILRELGVRLRAQRLAQELPQTELAAMAGVSLGTIKSLERGASSSMETFIRVVSALGLTSHLQPLFELPRQSIAQMEQAQRAQRVRAPRRKQP